MTSISLARPVELVDERHPLHLDDGSFRFLLSRLGPSLGLWRAAEIAALRECEYARPVLDLGCGDGLITSLVLPKVELGIDPNRRELAKAGKLGIYGRYMPLCAQDAPISSETIGTVLSNSVLEHIPRIDAVLDTISRVLRPGGRLILTSPTDAFGRWLAMPHSGYSRWRNRSLGHLNLWSASQWTSRLARAGLAVETIRPYLRRPLVWLWDVLELWQQMGIGRKRPFGMAWRRVPPAGYDLLARLLARLDLSAPPPGGGQLIVAKRT